MTHDPMGGWICIACVIGGVIITVVGMICDAWSSKK